MVILEALENLFVIEGDDVPQLHRLLGDYEEEHVINDHAIPEVNNLHNENIPYIAIMPPIGALGAFDEKNDNIKSYFMRFEAYAAVNQITDASRVNALIAVMGSRMFEELIAMCLPDEPSGKTYADIKAMLVDRYERYHLKDTQRHILASRRQKKDESVTNYLQELEILSKTCDYSTRARLEEDLKLIFVRNLNDFNIRKELLLMENPTFSQAVDRAKTLEQIFLQLDSSASGACGGAEVELAGAIEAVTFNMRGGVTRPKQYSSNRDTTKPWSPCYRCGRKHVTASCATRTWSCNNCGRVGHISRTCLQSRGHRKTRDQHTPQNQRKCINKKNAKINVIEDTGEASEVESDLTHLSSDELGDD
jgi:hypothetical protein